MKRYKVTVNGKVYEVELEAVDGPIEKTEPVKEKKKEAPKASSGKQEVLSPIAGKVLSIAVKAGDQVKKDQTIMVIEAMKLENEIRSPYDGKVAEIVVSTGDDVRNKDVLLVLE